MRGIARRYFGRLQQDSGKRAIPPLIFFGSEAYGFAMTNHAGRTAEQNRRY